MVVAEGLAKLVLQEQLAGGCWPSGRAPLQDSERTQVPISCTAPFPCDVSLPTAIMRWCNSAHVVSAATTDPV